MRLDNATDQELVDELAFRIQLRVIREELKKSRYCAKLGGDCKYMQGGECCAAKCKRGAKYEM